MLSSRYSGKELVEMRSSRSTVSSSRSGSEDYSGYSLITNDQCVNTPRAKVFLVATISGIIALIIVILVIVYSVTRLNTEQGDTPGSSSDCLFEEMCGYRDGCPSYVVIGGGLAGTYATWRLNQLKKTVFLYEQSNRVGGKLFTRQFHNVSDVNLEMGTPWFIPKLHPRISDLVNKLNLSVKPYYYGGNGDESEEIRYFTRGWWSSYQDAHKVYHLNREELQQNNPRTLLRKTLQSVVPFEIPDSPNATGQYSNGQCLRTALLGHLSTEAYRYIQDLSHQQDFQADANAAQYVEYLNQQEKENVLGNSDVATLVNGMMSLPETLLKQTSTTYTNYQGNRRLTQLQVQNQAIQLTFRKTTMAEDGSSRDTEEIFKTCAQTVILAIPPKDLKQVNWTGLTDWRVTQALNGIGAVPSHVMYLLYNGTFLANQVQNKSLWVKTDLPLGEVSIYSAMRDVVIYVPQETEEYDLYNNKTNNSSDSINITTSGTTESFTTTSQNEIFTRSNNTDFNNNQTSVNTTQEEELNVSTTETPLVPIIVQQPVTVVKAIFSSIGYHHYWKSLLRSGSPITDFSPSVHKITDIALEHVHVHLSKVLNMTVEDIPIPLDGYVEEADEFSSTEPMSYIWKPGFDWSSDFLYQPDPKAAVYVVGQAYAPSFYSLGVEGDLVTVDKLFT